MKVLKTILSLLKLASFFEATLTKPQYASTDMAKVQPFNLFLRPLDLFSAMWKRNTYKGKFSQKLHTILLKRHQKDQFFSCFADIFILKGSFFNCAARDAIFFQIWPAIKKVWPPLFKYIQIKLDQICERCSLCNPEKVRFLRGSELRFEVTKRHKIFIIAVSY